ncbi:MAG: bifunctional homocysteine S-methyltransferase/methylenetetrahydrofolate reductase [Anaerolineae bacterium]|nr:bifunctional homocysteine S-methyltransferase/methylenetetrahydrofolate reductase [Thermoflexus sp.]MDW8064705.1 bifunctional homocysteine S-methyltransferase/methylenetetrahydrofolate reductase [Anaerolineae bacterium]
MAIEPSLLERLAQGPLLADGAMGTMLYARGFSLDRCYEALNVEAPNVILEIHRAYLEAGAELLETNTFGANRYRLAEYGLEDQVASLNRAGVALARQAATEANRRVWIAGAVGPLGVPLAPLGRVKAVEARQAFREQIAALVEAGVDALILETFSSLPEIQEAIRAAQEIAPHLPIIAELTFAQDGYTMMGHTPEEVVKALLEMGVPIIGANCSVGPAKLLPVIRRMAARMAEAGGSPPCYLAVMPNAGWPEVAAGRLRYPATPDYFAEYARRFLDLGVRILGGCCGTTPEHIAAMRQALQRREKSNVQDRPHILRPISSPAPTEPEPTELARRLRAGLFVVSVEVDPPRGHDASALLEVARSLKAGGVDALNIADSPMARLRMSPWALAFLIQNHVGIETILHFPTRGRNLLRIQSDLLAIHALGVRNLLVLMGDPPVQGSYPNVSDAVDIVPSGLVQLIKERFNAGLDHAGESIGQPTAFFVGVALNFNNPDPDREIQSLHRKIRAGADFIMTQPVYDPSSLQGFLRRYEERHGPIPVPILAGVLPLMSLRHAEFLHNEVPGIQVPEAARERLRQAGEARARLEGLRIVQEVVAELTQFVHGIYVTPPMGRYELVFQIMEAIPSHWRRHVIPQPDE